MKYKYTSLILVGDFWGLSLLLKYIPHQLVSCLICSSIRPQYIKKIEMLGRDLNKKVLIQPPYKSKYYPTFFDALKVDDYDLLICNSYSLLIQENVLELVNQNAINIHPSLLPKNRGPHPTQWVIIKGETQTGVTMHYMDNQFDCGDLISQQEISIDYYDTWVSLDEKISKTTESLIKTNIDRILCGNNERTQQDSSLSSKNGKLNADFPQIDFKTMTDLEIYNLIRGQVSPLSGAFITSKDGKRTHFPTLTSMKEIENLRRKWSKSE